MTIDQKFINQFLDVTSKAAVATYNFLGKKDGLVHISALSEERVEKVTDVVQEGDEVSVKVIGFDRRGKVKLSMKDVDWQIGKELR